MTAQTVAATPPPKIGTSIAIHPGHWRLVRSTLVYSHVKTETGKNMTPSKTLPHASMVSLAVQYLCRRVYRTLYSQVGLSLNA